MSGNPTLPNASPHAIDADLFDTPATPLVFNASIDTTNMANVVLIDSTLADKQVFYDSANAKTFPIIYDYNSKTDDLLALFRQKFPASSIQRISLVFHGRGTNFMAAFMNNKPLFQESDLASGQTSFTENVSFLVSCLKEFHIGHIDFLACNTLQYSNWKSYYALLAAQTSVVVGASNDKTGNLNHGGDWVMESTHENIRDLYFNASIRNYASTLAAISISANGASQAIYLRMNGLIMEYSVGSVPGSYVPIASTDWPVTITNSAPTPNDSSKLRVVFTQDLTISSTYGDVLGYFIAGSTYITFDGSNNFININNITNYVGLIRNGSTATLTNGYANVIVQNIKTNVTGGSLNGAVSGSRAGWICAGSFGRGAAANQIINCTNNGAISTLACGGICGDRPGTLGGSVTFVNCTNSGIVSGDSAGGIVAVSAGRFSGSATFTGCTNSGLISGQDSGGISGGSAGYDSGSARFTDCRNSGLISGLSAGGIAGSYAGETGSATFTSCTNSGAINAQWAGGIAGLAAGGSGSARFTNCTNTGQISGNQVGGIAGAQAGQNGSVTFTDCANSGDFTSTGSNAGGIAGTRAGFSNGSASFTNCTNSGAINGESSGGIAGLYAGLTNGLVSITGCTNNGTISGQRAGGIVGKSAGETGSATITNCANSGQITGLDAGGIAGAYAGTISGSATFTNCTNSGDISNQSAGGIVGSYAGNDSGSSTITNCSSTGIISGVEAGGIVGLNAGYINGLCNITNCFSTGDISGRSSGGIAGNQFADNTSQPCNITNSYSTGAISGLNAGGIVGSNVGYNNNATYTPVVNITNSYSLGTIATTCGGICGGTFDGSITYTNKATISISNCYSYGTLTGTGAGLVAATLTSSNINLTTPNTYVAAGSWTDASANAPLALTGTPTGVGLANKGVTWTSYASANTPYLLSSYWSLTGASQLYTPNSVSSFTNYTSSGGLYTSGTYSIASSSQADKTITLNVVRISSTSPYYGYYGGTFALTNLNGGSGSPISATINASSGVLDIILPYPCFLEGTKILCFENNEEVYRPVESLRKGDLVKTIYNGYVPVCMMGTTSLYNPGNDYRITNRLYKCPREKYPTLFEDLYITGCHSILVPQMTNDQWENTKAVNGNIYVTDNHFRLIACADEKAEPFNKEGYMNIYHIALEHHEICMNYGIYANGLLVESCSIDYLIKYSNLKIMGQEDSSVSQDADKVLSRQLVETY